MSESVDRGCILCDTALPIVGNITSKYDIINIEKIAVGDTVNNYIYSTNTVSPAIILGFSISKVIDSKCKWYRVSYLKDLVPISIVVSEDVEFLMPDGTTCKAKDINNKISVMFDHESGGARYEIPMMSKRVSKWRILWSNLKEYSTLLRQRKKEGNKDIQKEVRRFSDLPSNRYIHGIGIRPEYGFMTSVDNCGFIILSNGLAVKSTYYVNYKHTN